MNTDNARIKSDGNLRGEVEVTEKKVYENALALELRRRHWLVDQQRDVEVWYKGEKIGIYQADLIVEGKVVVELKVVAALDRAHRAQCMNYLRATRLGTGLVINFGRPRLEVQRVVSAPPTLLDPN